MTMYDGGTFAGINTALRGLMAQQAQLDVTSHNISNVDTPGYSRQSAIVKESTPYTLPAMNMTMPGQLGTGVNVTGYARARDQFLDRTTRSQLSSQGTSSGQLGSLQQVEADFQEPGDNGISSYLQNFFSALDTVAQNSSDPSARTSFAMAGQALAKAMNQLSTNITGVQGSLDDRLNQDVTDINQITSQIATLNTQIHNATIAGQQPNDMLDERDQLMDQLSSYVNYSYTTDPSDNTVTITMGTTTPITLDAYVPSPGAGSTPITRADLDTAYGNGDITAGTSFGEEQLQQVTLPGYITKLDNLTSSIVTGMNTQNAAGFDLTGAAGGDLFVAGGTTAATMAFNPAVLADPSLVAAASSWNAPGEPGNGDNANAMEDLRTAVQGPPMNATWENYYQGVVSGVGTDAQQMQKDVTTQQAIVTSLNARRQSVSGVSLDEEMSNMITYQHAYSAAARVLTAFDQNLDTIINKMGTVGL